MFKFARSYPSKMTCLYLCTLLLRKRVCTDHKNGLALVGQGFAGVSAFVEIDRHHRPNRRGPPHPRECPSSQPSALDRPAAPELASPRRERLPFSVSLSLAHGARRDILRWITHGSEGDIVSQYTSLLSRGNKLRSCPLPHYPPI